MSRSLNKVQLLGNLGKDPEVKTFTNGNQVVKTTLATSESWKDKQTGEQKEQTQWHNIVIYNKGLGDVLMKYAKKGSKIYLEGRIESRSYTDNDQVQRMITEIVVPAFGIGDLVLCGDAKDSKTSSQFSDIHDPFA